jgi:hypothetical protein
MIEITNSVGFTVSFDGRVIEAFGTTCTRMHINNVKSVELKEGRKGELGIFVTGRWSGGFSVPGFDPSDRSTIEDLVAQINTGIK